MTDLVREVILEPMCKLYPSSQHLRDNPKALSLALASYAKALARFDRATLRSGWDKLVAEQTFWCWPNPGEIAAACRQCEPRPKSPADEEMRKQKALELADAYTNRYMKTSHVAKLAKREGWSGRLRDYVHAAASVQAQLISGAQNVGWNANLADELGVFRSSAAAFAAYRETIRKPVESGHVRVTVPRSRIRAWNEEGICHKVQDEEERARGRDAG